jgi:GNAT superfamily N-acetyltransferase
MALIEKLKPNGVDALFEFLKGKKSAPRGLVKSYLWERSRHKHFGVYYSKDGAIDNVFYKYCLQDGAALEQWYSTGKTLEDFALELAGMFEGNVQISFFDRKIGEKNGWEHISDVIEFRRKTEPTQSRSSNGRPEDIEGIVELMMQEWWTEEQARDFLSVGEQNPKAFSRVVKDGKRILAYGHCSYDADKAWIDAMYVDKESRGKGFGSEILLGIIGRLHALKVPEVYCGTEEGTEAAKFYEKNGFKRTDYVRYQFMAKRGGGNG